MLTGTYHYPRADGVVFGLPWPEALRSEVERLGARKVFAVVSSSLKAAMPLEADLRRALGERLAGVGDGVRAHSPREDVARVASAARDAGADLLVAVGGGSVVDAAKVAQLCIAHSVFAAEAFDALRGKRREGAAAAELAVRVVAVPTTLSGAEFTAIAGVTNVARNVKEGYAHPDLAPRTVVLDPRVTVHTPAALWLSTGIRAVDHAVEDLCSINSQPLADAASLHALRLLSRGLRRTKADPGDLDARLDSMIGAWLSLVGTQGGVQKGASHAIGHVLGGTAGVPSRLHLVRDARARAALEQGGERRPPEARQRSAWRRQCRSGRPGRAACCRSRPAADLARRESAARTTAHNRRAHDA